MLRRVRDCLQEFLPSSHLETRLSKSLRKSEARKKKIKNTEYPHQETNASPSQDERATRGIFLQIRVLGKKPPDSPSCSSRTGDGRMEDCMDCECSCSSYGGGLCAVLRAHWHHETGMQQGLRRYKTLPKPLSELWGTLTGSGGGWWSHSLQVWGDQREPPGQGERMWATGRSVIQLTKSCL